MKIENFDKAKPIIEKLKRLEINRNLLEARINETEGKSLKLGIHFSSREVTTIINGEDIDTSDLLWQLVNSLQNEIDEIYEEIKNI